VIEFFVLLPPLDASTREEDEGHIIPHICVNLVVPEHPSPQVISLPQTASCLVSMFKISVVLGIPAGTFQAVAGTRSLHLSPTQTLLQLGLTDGCTVQILPTGRGGGGKRKVRDEVSPRTKREERALVLRAALTESRSCLDPSLAVESRSITALMKEIDDLIGSVSTNAQVELSKFLSSVPQESLISAITRGTSTNSESRLALACRELGSCSAVELMMKQKMIGDVLKTYSMAVECPPLNPFFRKELLSKSVIPASVNDFNAGICWSAHTLLRTGSFHSRRL
jgi:hypothetical protein